MSAATVGITFDCCAAPTVLTAPTTTATSFDYFIGDTTLNIPLSGTWTSDALKDDLTDCCTLDIDTYTFVPTAPAGLFTVSGDKLSIDVYSTDVSTVGAAGLLYSVTVAPLASSSCVDVSSESISYSVNLVNKCIDAVFTFDSTIFQTVGTASVT